MDDFLLMNIFRLCSGLKLSFEHNSAQKNLLLIAYRSGDDRLSLTETDQKLKFGDVICFGESYLEFLFVLSNYKHSMQNYMIGAVRSYSGKGPRYCYKIGPGPNFRLLSHATGLFFCLQVNVFLLSFSKSVNF